MGSQAMYRAAAVLAAVTICAQGPLSVMLGGEVDWAAVAVAWFVLGACFASERTEGN